MHFPSAFILAALPFLAAATQPLKSRQATPSFNLLSIHSGDQSVHNQPIVAADEYFYINRNSSAACDSSNTQAGCTAQTQILLGNSTADLNVAVPGGQQIFVTSTGALSYTPPHSHLVPAGARSTGFNAFTDSDSGANAIMNLGFGGTEAPDWLACPLEQINSYVYQIFANVTGVQVSGISVSDCTGIAIALVAGNATQAPFQFN